MNCAPVPSLKPHAERISHLLKEIFPHLDLRYRSGVVEILAGTDRWPSGGIKTVPGYDDYSGIAIRIYPGEGRPFVRVDEINVAAARRGEGLSLQMLRAVGETGLEIVHGMDLSQGWWAHIEQKYPDLLNRQG